ncbi:mesaconyl-C(4)-CoA hydratase [Trichophyton mentagrophytes]|nr:mesaconyl-C(4)-CoA hydratase [Trichophyton mentagrophytes]
MVQLARVCLGPRLTSFLQRRALATAPALSNIEGELVRRRLPLIYDYLSPQPSHLLSLSLDSLNVSTPGSSTSSEPQWRLPSITRPVPMPRGHHLIYFPPQVPSSELLPDGCDELHSPGQPYNRRMWAGGSVRFFGDGGPLLNGQRAVCVEGIREVNIKGKEGEEKIFVGIERRVATVDEHESDDAVRSRVWTQSEEEQGASMVIERRNLVFMRDRTSKEIEAAKSGADTPPRRIMKIPATAELSQTIIPSKSLLFRYSALTFNAHAIHLDRDYARNVEGYNDLLVHGPLTLTIMLSTFQKHAATLGQVVSSIEYRNLAPLLVEHKMKVCAARKSNGSTGSWDIWVEDNDGGLAAKGTIKTVPVEPDQGIVS